MKYETRSDGRRELVIDSFGGLDRASALCGGQGSFELRNFRPMEDGTLLRREGLVPAVTMQEQIRGAIGIERNGTDEIYVVAGSGVYYVYEDTVGYTTTTIGSLKTDSGLVTFLCYDGALLMQDGQQLYTLTPTSADVTEAYVPLYGNGWPSSSSVPTTAHTVYELPNQLSRRLRIGCVMDEDSRYIALPILSPETVDALLIDGVPYTGNFSYSASPHLISMNDELAAGTKVEVYVTMPAEFFKHADEVKSARRMATLGRAEEEQVMFYGLSDTAQVYISRVPEKALQVNVRTVVPTACMLYVTEQDKMTIGDGVHAVTGACRHYDRSLIFTARGTWMSDGSRLEDGTLSLIPVNTVLGCSSEGAVALSGNAPITVQSSHVLCWNSKTDERDECNAAPISRPIETLLRADFGKRAAVFSHAVRGEIWFYVPDTAGRILIYQSERERWTSFDGFAPRCVFRMGDRVGIAMEKTLYYMEEAATADTLVTDEHPEGERVGIVAEYKSSFLDFGVSTRQKRMCRAAVVASCDRAALRLCLYNVNGRKQERELAGDGNEISLMQTRGWIGRFRFLRVGIVFDQDSPLRLHEIRLSAHSG